MTAGDGERCGPTIYCMAERRARRQAPISCVHTDDVNPIFAVFWSELERRKVRRKTFPRCPLLSVAKKLIHQVSLNAETRTESAKLETTLL